MGMLIGGGITLSLVNFFGNGSQHRGFVITELIMTVLVLFGYAVLVYIGKNYDLPKNPIKKQKSPVSPPNICTFFFRPPTLSTIYGAR